MAVRAFITGIDGPKLTAEEEGFLREAEPWGLILFKRNLETQAQITATIDNFRNAIGRNAPVLVDFSEDPWQLAAAIDRTRTAHAYR